MWIDCDGKYLRPMQKNARLEAKWRERQEGALPARECDPHGGKRW